MSEKLILGQTVKNNAAKGSVKINMVKETVENDIEEQCNRWKRQNSHAIIKSETLTHLLTGSPLLARTKFL
jgi:hypothetical protein